MNNATFTQLLEDLAEGDWQAVVDGQSLLLVDDERLAPGPANAPNVIFSAGDTPERTGGQLRQAALAEAAGLLENYYRTHPLTQAGFNRQVRQLVAHHGAEAFCATAGDYPQRSLFVAGGEVIAEPAASPRHRYGAFCELDRPVAGTEAGKVVDQWLDSGESYERYLSMNVCRYNC